MLFFQPSYERPPVEHLAQMETDEWSTDTEQAPHPPPHQGSARPGYREVLTVRNNTRQMGLHDRYWWFLNLTRMYFQETTRTNIGQQQPKPIQNGPAPHYGQTVVETVTTAAPPYTPYREEIRPDSLWANGDHRPLKGIISFSSRNHHKYSDRSFLNRD